MNWLSLFDGIRCAHVAAERAGIPVTNYYASEIDKYAMRAANNRFPNVVNVGCVKKLARYFCASARVINYIQSSPYLTFETKQLIKAVKQMKEQRIDIVVGGSPCQGFSFAGKQLNFNDPRSKLFFEFARILKECQRLNPSVLFLLENVPMIKQSQAVINETLGLFPVEINAALVSAQNRKRLFWTNIKTRKDGLFGDTFTDIPQPKDRGILMSDILEPEVPEKYMLSETALRRIQNRQYSSAKINPEKSGTINTKNNSGQLSSDSGTTLISVTNMNGVLSSVGKSTCVDSGYSKGMDNHGQSPLAMIVQGGREKDLIKASCYTAGAKSAGNHSQQDLIIQRSRGKNTGGERGKNGKTPSVSANSFQHNNFVSAAIRSRSGAQTIEISNSPQKSNALTSQTRDRYVARRQPPQQDRVNTGEKSRTIPAQEGSNWTKTQVGPNIRRLTPTEVLRLFTLPDDYFLDENGTPVISESQQYKCLGNGWVIDVIVHIFSFIEVPKHKQYLSS